jgi:glycosyltransferase involved in cell wall biosynthesis
MSAAGDIEAKETPRLLIVTESFGVGGTESHLIRTLPLLKQQGFSIAAFCLSARGSRAGEVESAGIEISTPANDSGRGFRRPWRLASAAPRLYGLMRRFQPDIAHFYLPGPYVIGAPVAIAARVPVKVMSRRSLSDYQANWPVAAAIERRLHGTLAAAVGNSRAVVDELRGEGVPEERLRLIYNGVDLPVSAPPRETARARFGLRGESVGIAVVANLIPYQGHRDLIEALALIPEDGPPLRILAAGRDQGIRAELEALAAERGVSDRMVFLGEDAHIPTLLAAADLGLLPSHEEGFSNVVLEGMAASLPMIVTAVGGNPEAVVDGVTGLVVPPRNPKALAASLVRLAGDPGLRMQFGEAAKRRATQEFSLASCVDAHASLYRDLLAAARVRTSRRSDGRAETVTNP